MTDQEYKDLQEDLNDIGDPEDITFKIIGFSEKIIKR